MEWLNYHHLLYFWVVAKEGGLVAAGKVLRVSHPTLSAQIRALEDRLGEKLFNRVGRKLALTETGTVVFRYADEIFTLGREMVDAVEGRAIGPALRLNVGIVDSIPKLVVHRLLEPILALTTPVRLVCREDSYERLLASLASHALDVVIADTPVAPGSPVRAYNHFLGETDVGFFGTKAIVEHYNKGFPKSLTGAPFLLPLEALTLRRALDHWFDRNGIHPAVVGEFEDSALMKVFASKGSGLFPAPMVITDSVMAQYGLQLLGRVPEVKERFYAVTGERRIKHPAVVAMCDVARQAVFSAGS